MPRNSRSLTLQRSFHDRVAAVTRNTAKLVDSTYRAMRADDLTGSFRVVIPQATQLVALGQAEAARLAAGFYRAYSGLETGHARSVAFLEDNVGRTFDGRPVRDALNATPSRVFYAITSGKTVSEALRYGRFSIARTVRTEVFDAARMELGHQIENDSDALGWNWQSRGTCEACLALDDEEIRGPGEPLEAHEQCSCIQSPRFDEKERVSRPTGLDRFLEMSKTEQFGKLGVGKALLVRERRVSMNDLYVKEESREWRARFTRRSLEDLLKIAGMTQDELDKLIAAEGLDPTQVNLTPAA